MASDWYYSHAGVTHGPLTVEEIKEQARRKNLLEDDLVWQGSNGRSNATTAGAALDFLHLPLVAAPAPDWLTDVANAETTGPVPATQPTKDVPPWLEDVRLWFGLEIYAAAKTSEPTPGGAPQAAGMPDWLEGWVTPETPTGRQSQPAGTFPASPQAKKPVLPQEIPPASLPVATPVKTAAPPAPHQTSQPTFVENLGSAKEKVIPVAIPVAKPVQKASPALKPQDRLAERAIQETGFDLTTGQILDQEKFRKWQKANHATQLKVSNESLFEVFRKSRLAIENWVDEDCNRPLVMAGNLGAIKKDLKVVAILQKHPGYGAVLQDKLIQHLEFMVENRRKYYSARARQGDKG